MKLSLNGICSNGGWSLGHFFTMPENSWRELISRKHWFSTLDESETAPFKEMTESFSGLGRGISVEGWRPWS